MTPCPLCLHRAHLPGKCATPSIDGCTCGMNADQIAAWEAERAAAWDAEEADRETGL